MRDEASAEPNWGVVGLLGHLDHDAAGAGPPTMGPLDPHGLAAGEGVGG